MSQDDDDARVMLRVAMHNIEARLRAEAVADLTQELTGHMQYEVCTACKHYRSQFPAGSGGKAMP